MAATAASGSPTPPKKRRKPNFSAVEEALLIDLTKQHLSVLTSSFTNSVTNQKKKLIWQNITEQINATGVEKRTALEVKTKWHSMSSKAKSMERARKQHMHATGGGPPPPQLPESAQKIIELYSACPSWTGIDGGIETEAPSSDQPPQPGPATAADAPACQVIKNASNNSSKLARMFASMQGQTDAEVPLEDNEEAEDEDVVVAAPTPVLKKAIKKKDDKCSVKPCRCICPTQHQFFEQELKCSILRERKYQLQILALERDLGLVENVE